MLSFNWLPIGGFVKLKGEHDRDSRKGSFGAASVWSKSKIMMAGVFMNLVVGLLILTILALIGMPRLISKADYGVDQYTVASDTRISRQEALIIYVEPGSPAETAGLKSFDVIRSVSDGKKTFSISSPQQLKQATTQFAGREVSITYEDNGRNFTKTVALRNPAEVQASLKTDNPKGYLGVEPYQLIFTKSSWSAPIVAVGFTAQLIDLTAKGLWHALSGLGSVIAGVATFNHQARVNGQTEATAQVGGPIAIFKIISSSGSLGLSYMLAIIAIVSLTLAFMNVLPIPALDGGRLFVTLLYRKVLRRPLANSTEEWIHGAGMAVLLTLMVLVTIVDFNRFY